MSRLSACAALITFLCLSGVAYPDDPPVQSGKAQVLLAPDSSGDFGPQTPGTKTSGWQEALNFCVANARDLYVKGGFGGRQAIYHIDDTIRFPAAQDFRVDGGVYVINFRGPDPNIDAVIIDSCMNCEYHLGIIVYGGKGAGLRIKPENPVPIDNFPTVIETRIESQGIADPRPFEAGKREGGMGLVIDASIAGVNYTKLYFASILNFSQCIAIGGAKGFYSNEFVCEHLHTNAHQSLLAAIDPIANANHFRFGIGVDQGATGVRGIDLSGYRNVLDLSSRGGGFVKGQQLILEPTAEGNQINFRTSEDVLAAVQDLAKTPTNQLSWTGPPAPIRTAKGESGSWTYVQRLYPAMVSLTNGAEAEVTFQRGKDTVVYAPPQNREILLSVGDQLIIKNRVAPELRIVPVKPN